MVGKRGSGVKNEKTHVVVTRYEPPKGTAPIVHAWGPYTLGQAVRARRRMLQEAEVGGYAHRFEVNSLRVKEDVLPEPVGDPETWPQPGS